MERTTNNRDKRQVYLQLSKEGHEFHDEVAQEFATVLDELDIKLGEDAIDLLENLKKAQSLLSNK